MWSEQLQDGGEHDRHGCDKAATDLAAEHVENEKRKERLRKPDHEHVEQAINRGTTKIVADDFCLHKIDPENAADERAFDVRGRQRSERRPAHAENMAATAWRNRYTEPHGAAAVRSQRRTPHQDRYSSVLATHLRQTAYDSVRTVTARS